MRKPKLSIHPAPSHEELEEAVRMFLAKGGSITVLEPKSTAYPIGCTAQYELDEPLLEIERSFLHEEP